MIKYCSNFMFLIKEYYIDNNTNNLNLSFSLVENKFLSSLLYLILC